MSDHEEMLWVVLISMAFVIAAGSLGYGIGTTTADRQLLSRGLKEYDKQTGRLIWTEKAGGEKGGGK